MAICRSASQPGRTAPLARPLPALALPSAPSVPFPAPCPRPSSCPELRDRPADRPPRPPPARLPSSTRLPRRPCGRDGRSARPPTRSPLRRSALSLRTALVARSGRAGPAGRRASAPDRGMPLRGGIRQQLQLGTSAADGGDAGKRPRFGAEPRGESMRLPAASLRHNPLCCRAQGSQDVPAFVSLLAPAACSVLSSTLKRC